MATEKTLLQQIREKELLLNIKIEEARREAERQVGRAKEEARTIIEESEKAEEAAAREYYTKEMEELEKEIGELKDQAARETLAVRERGERGLSRAVDLIIRSVSME
jgi:vacuolar-type H+-ATPase subunit H